MKKIFLITFSLLMMLLNVSCITEVNYVIDFYGDDELYDSSKVKEGEFTFPEDPEKDGYTFLGWYYGEDNDIKLTEDIKITSNLTVYAKWELIEYTITYNLDGGTANNPSTYNTETPSFTLEHPDKDGYIFTGWTTSNDHNSVIDLTVN